MIELIKLFLKINLRSMSNFFGFMDTMFFKKIESTIDRLLLPKIGKWSSFRIRVSAGLLYFCIAGLISTTFLLLLTASSLALAFSPGVFMILYLTYFAISTGAFIWGIRAFNKFKAKIPSDGKIFWPERFAQQTFNLISTPCRYVHNTICNKLLSKVINWGGTPVKILGALFFWLEEFIIIETTFIVLGAIFAPSFSIIAPLTFAGLILSFTPGFITSISAFAFVSEGLGNNNRNFLNQVKAKNSELKNQRLEAKIKVHEWHAKSSRNTPEPKVMEEKKSQFFNPIYSLYNRHCGAGTASCNSQTEKPNRRPKHSVKQGML